MTFATVPQDENMQMLYAEALQMIRDERDAAAVQMGVEKLDQVLAAEPDFAEGYYNRAGALMMLGRILEAIADFEHLIEVGYDGYDVYYHAGLLCRVANRPEDAKKYLKHVIENYPKQKQALADYGNILFEQQNYDEAMEYYHKALELDVKDFAMFLRMGAYHIERNDEEGAIEFLTKAKQSNPTNYLPYYYRGNCYYALGKFEEALDDYDKAAFLDPNFAEVYYKTGCVYYEIGDYDNAIQQFSLMTSILPESEVGYFHIGLAALEKEDFDMAIEQSIEIYDKDPNAYFLLAQAYAGQGNEEKAVEAYAKAEELGFEAPAE